MTAHLLTRDPTERRKSGSLRVLPVATAMGPPVEGSFKGFYRVSSIFQGATRSL